MLSRRPVLIAALISGALPSACRGNPQPGPLDFRPVRQTGTFVAESNGRPIGRVVTMEIEDPAGIVRFHRALNASGQWLGYVDDSNRVFKRQPFVEREVNLGIYAMEDGLALLYEVEGPVRLVPLDEFEAREAAHRPESAAPIERAPEDPK